MRRRLVWDKEARDWVEKASHTATAPAGPTIWSDLPAYVSPCSPAGSPYVVEGRAARREDLKRNGCREVDPSEFTPRLIEPGSEGSPGFDPDYSREFYRRRSEFAPDRPHANPWEQGTFEMAKKKGKGGRKC